MNKIAPVHPYNRALREAEATAAGGSDGPAGGTPKSTLKIVQIVKPKQECSTKSRGMLSWGSTRLRTSARTPNSDIRDRHTDSTDMNDIAVAFSG